MCNTFSGIMQSVSERWNPSFYLSSLGDCHEHGSNSSCYELIIENLDHQVVHLLDGQAVYLQFCAWPRVLAWKACVSDRELSLSRSSAVQQEEFHALSAKAV